MDDDIPESIRELARQEILKFTAVPNARPAGQGKITFVLKTPDGQFITAEVSHKAWNKLSKAAQDWPVGTAALSGTMEMRTDQGFTLANPGLKCSSASSKRRWN